MKPEHDAAKLAPAFPTLTEQQLADCLGADGGSLPQLAQDHNTEFFTAVARAIIAAAPSAALGVSFPGLRELANAVVLGGTFTARPHLALRLLRDRGNYTWGDLAARTPSQLGALSNMSERSLAEVVGVAARASVLVLPGVPSHSPKPAPPADPEPVVVGSRRAGASAPVVAATSKPLPFGWTDRVTQLEEALGDDRDRAIFWASIDVERPRHVSMARRFGLSAERVRQLRIRVEQAAKAAIARPPFVPLQRHADTLGQRLGLGFSPAAPWARATIASAVEVVDPPWRTRVQHLLLWLAGPYRGNEFGWVARGPLPDRGDVLSDATDVFRHVDVKTVEALLAKAGVVHEAVGDWLVHVAGLRRIADEFYVWEGSVGDKAFAVLSAWERPATVAELVDAIGEGHGPRSTRGHLLCDPRFKRVDRTRLGLRSWPQDEYTGTVEELVGELHARGGNADAGELVRSVAQRFDLSVVSVQAQTRAPRFVVEGTRVRFRRTDEPYQPGHSLTEAPHCYRLGEAECSYRLAVDAQALRGSALWIPDALGAWLGVLPGTHRDFCDGTTDVRVSWSENSITGPFVGSVRRMVAHLDGTRGDQLLLRFDRRRFRFSASLVRRHELVATTPEQQVAALTGLAADGPLLDAVADAVGVTTAALADHLRSRRETDLLALLSEGWASPGGSPIQGIYDQRKRPTGRASPVPCEREGGASLRPLSHLHYSRSRGVARCN